MHQQQQQKNTMEFLGSNPTGLNTARHYIAGKGTQTAALAFGGSPIPTKEQPKNMMVLLGQVLIL
jgi:hypothetical protein